MGEMRRFAAATVLLTALLAGASAASAADIGANDDSGKYEADGGAAFYRQMAALGLRQVVMPVRFKPSEPLVIQDKQALDRTVPSAIEAGLKVVLAVYPYPPRELEAGLGTPSLFGSYAGAVAQIYPQVKEFVIGNEPNQPAFWRPQFGSGGRNVSAAAFGQYLATAYDALKAVDPAITVVGVGLSPRGNDRPTARNNVSTSPMRFLRALGAWYRASERTKPLMDAFSFHPYPNQATDPLERGYSWPNAGFANLDRVKQALWDAFRGTPQPTTTQGLGLHLDEVGWQVATSRAPGYTGSENVPVTDEITQAAIYGELIRRAACDPDVTEVSFFGFRDDGARAGFQAGLHRLDGTARPSAVAVEAAIGETTSGCHDEVEAWKPQDAVVGARVALRTAALTSVNVKLGAGEDAQALVCVRADDRLRRLCKRAAVPGLRTLDLAVTAPKTAVGFVHVSVELRADANRTRKTVVVKEASLRR
jgi:hypothetical protein